MTDFISQDRVQGAKLSSMLMDSEYEKVKEATGKIFQEKDFA